MSKHIATQAGGVKWGLYLVRQGRLALRRVAGEVRWGEPGPALPGLWRGVPLPPLKAGTAPAGECRQTVPAGFSSVPKPPRCSGVPLAPAGRSPRSAGLRRSLRGFASWTWNSHRGRRCPLCHRASVWPWEKSIYICPRFTTTTPDTCVPFPSALKLTGRNYSYFTCNLKSNTSLIHLVHHVHILLSSFLRAVLSSSGRECVSLESSE